MPPPNILFITTDHQQWRTIAGRSPCRTPNINRLAEQGLLFDRSYAPAPVCCPVRAMWMSGAYPWHNGVHNQVHSSPSLNRDMLPGVVTYSQRLRQAGYRLGMVGKWHASQVRTPLDFGFHDFPRSSDGPPAGSLPELRHVCEKQFQWPGSEPFEMWGVVEGPVERLNTTRIADRAVELLGEYAAGGRPWHLAVHFPEPHDPYYPHVDYARRYDPADMPVPASFADEFAGKPQLHRRESETWGEFSEDDVRYGTARFFAYCEQIDDQVGRILDALDASGQADNTLVAFTADHADMLGAHRMWIKSWMPYDEAWRVPLVVRFPGRVAAGGGCPRMVLTHELSHTFLELAGAEPLPHADGRSLTPLLAEPGRDDWEDAVLCVSYGCEFLYTQRMVVTPRWKYVFNGFAFDEMYDLANDPDEMHNLIDDERHAGERGELRAKLWELMNRFGDPYGDTGAEPGPSCPPNRYGAARYLPRS